MSVSISTEVKELTGILSSIEENKIHVLVDGYNGLDERLQILIQNWHPILRAKDLENKATILLILYQISNLIESAVRELNSYDIHQCISVTKFLHDSFYPDIFFFYNLFPWDNSDIYIIREIFNISTEKGLIQIQQDKLIFKKTITQLGAGYFIQKLKKYLPDNFLIYEFTKHFVWFESKKMSYKSLTKEIPSPKIYKLINSVFETANKTVDYGELNDN